MQQRAHIVIVSAVYPPEPVVSARMARDLAVHLVHLGHQVTVLCPQPTRPASADYRGYRCSGAPFRSVEEEVEVVRLPSFTSVKSLLVPRLRESWSFGRHVCRYLDQQQLRPDALYVNSWPLLSQFLVIRYAHQHRIAATLQIMDVYPESLLTKLPALLRHLLSWPLRRLDGWYSRRAASLVVISEQMRSIYERSRGVSADRIVTIPTWQDETVFSPLPTREEACRRYGVPVEPFTFLYLGNMGPVAGVDLLVTAFHEAHLENAQLVLAGDGSAKEACQRLSARLGAERIHFVSDPDAANVPLLQSLAHVCLLPMKRGAAFSSIPSKMPAYLFSAKPVLATVDVASDTARIILDNGCGWVGGPEDVHWLADMMRVVSRMNLQELNDLGERGRACGIEHFSRSHGIAKLANRILG